MITIELPVIFDREGVCSVLPAFQAALGGQHAIEVPAAAVEQIGTAGVQFIASATRTALDRGISFQLIGASSALQEALELAGLTAFVARNLVCEETTA